MDRRFGKWISVLFIFLLTFFLFFVIFVWISFLEVVLAFGLFSFRGRNSDRLVDGNGRPLSRSQRREIRKRGYYLYRHHVVKRDSWWDMDDYARRNRIDALKVHFVVFFIMLICSSVAGLIAYKFIYS